MQLARFSMNLQKVHVFFFLFIPRKKTSFNLHLCKRRTDWQSTACSNHILIRDVNFWLGHQSADNICVCQIENHLRSNKNERKHKKKCEMYRTVYIHITNNGQFPTKYLKAKKCVKIYCTYHTYTRRKTKFYWK